MQCIENKRCACLPADLPFCSSPSPPLPPASLPLLQHIRAPDGSEFRVTKGAPQVIAKLCGADANPELKMRVEAEVANLGSRGIRSLAVARTLPGTLDQWEMLGMLTFLDPPRPDTKQTIEQVLRKGSAGEKAWGQHADSPSCLAQCCNRCCSCCYVPLTYPITNPEINPLKISQLEPTLTLNQTLAGP